MNLKVGNKYLCKKSLNFNKEPKEIKIGDQDSKILKYQYYKLEKIGANHVMIYSDISYECLSITKNCNVTPWYFYDYFYTNQELRKIKLEKLKNYQKNTHMV